MSRLFKIEQGVRGKESILRNMEVQREESYRIECFKDGEFKKLYIVNSRDEAGMMRCNWETSGKTYSTRMFKCNKNGNNYSGREIYDAEDE